MKTIFWPPISGYRNINLGLERVFLLLERLGNPQNNLPPTIHIAGTNGKGSNTAFLRHIFAAHNIKTHCYISPHLVYFNERILINNQPIENNLFNQVLETCKKAADQLPKIEVTFFEGLTVAAILAFSQVKAQILILETGMGGRLDATNILSKIICAIITPIHFDHQNFLGNSLKQIATEKAGIIKKNCPTIIAPQEKEALETLISCVAEKNSQYYLANHHFGIRNFNNNSFQYWQSSNYLPNLENNHKNNLNFEEITLEKIGLLGNYQKINCATAIKASLIALNHLNLPANHQLIAQGIANCKWQARLEKITAGKFYEKIKNANLENKVEIILDGSHNLQGSQTLLEFLTKYKEEKPNCHIICINAMLEDKDYKGFLSNISKIINHFIFSQIIDEPKTILATKLATFLQEVNFINRQHIHETTNINNAFDLAIRIIMQNLLINQCEYLILITGSLYFAGNFIENS